MLKTYSLMIKLFLLAMVVVALFFVTEKKFDYLKTNTFNSKPVTMAEREKQLVCLAKNIYFEAGNEPFEGKVAVAQVTINRMESGKFPSDLCHVVFQKSVFTSKVVCQFSWYCEQGPKVPSHKESYDESMRVAKKVLLENFRLPSLDGAMYYHADYVNPNWNLPKITKIGRHIFYGEKQNGK